MFVEKNKIDSLALGKAFLDIKDFSTDTDFSAFEKEYIKTYNPYYVVCKIPVENIKEIHHLEKFGFNFIEFQIKETFAITKTPDVSAFPQYKFEEVKSEEDLEKILKIASECFADDRFTIDPKMGVTAAAERYKMYVKQSYNNKDEFLYKLTNLETNEIVAFKTHKILENNEALMFLGGVDVKHKKTAIPGISSMFELAELKKKGVKKLATHISGRNYAVMNIEIRGFKFKVAQAYIVLRKIYE